MQKLSHSSGGDNAEIVPQCIETLRQYVGDVVFLPCNNGKGGKGAIIPAWQELTLARMSPAHFRQCERPEYRIGILHGTNSGGLCGQDCDDDAFAAELLRLNPWLAGTLTTRCNRGLMHWLRLKDKWPCNATLYWRGLRAGEWRADGNQSVIAGQDTKTGNWRVFVTKAPAMTVEWQDIKWPEGAEYGGDTNRHPWPPSANDPNEWHLAGSSQASLQAPIKDVEQGCRTNLRSTSPARARSTSSDERRLKQERLYRDLVSHLAAKKGERNAILNVCVNYLIHAIAETLVLRFLLRHYDENAAKAGWDDRREHERSILNLIAGCVRDYPEKLSAVERAIYVQLDEGHERAAFRILRDLAPRDDPDLDAPPGLIRMAYGELAARLDCGTGQAEEILKRKFAGKMQIVSVEIPGTKREKGQRGNATLWRWRLGLEPRPV